MQKKLELIIFYGSLFLFSYFVQAESPSWFLSKKDTHYKWAVIPSPSRNDTYGYMGSLRAFIYPSYPLGYYAALSTTVSEESFFSFNLDYQYWNKNGTWLEIATMYDGFSDPYYGEGGDTKVNKLKYISSDKISVRAQYVFQVDSFLYAGTFANWQYREETEKDPIFPRESVVSVGVLFVYDSRDNRFHPSKGEYYSIRSWLLAKTSSPLFAEASARLFVPLSQKLVLAEHGKIGITMLQPPSFLFRFNLGGPDMLRGFHLGRFRGRQYYLSQTEIRYSLFQFLTIAAFVDLGVADKDALTLPPRLSYGAGVRIGFPPHYHQKLRIEYGVGEDQKNLMIAFDHPF